MASRRHESTKSDLRNKSTFIARHPLFVDIPVDIQNRTGTYVKSKHYDRGETIFTKGDPSDCLFLVYKGIVKIDVQSRDGKEIIFNLVKEGECFGEIAALDGLPRTANASAFTNCEVMIIHRRDLILLVEMYPLLSLRLVQTLCSRLRRTTEQVENLKFVDLAGRLARTLIELAVDSATPGRIGLSQQEIAQITGLSREMTNRQLRVWAKEGWISLARKEIIILKSEEFSNLVSYIETGLPTVGR
jgi:CRP/FNR family cyclic AMP-dependent transcriptional regulator